MRADVPRTPLPHAEERRVSAASRSMAACGRPSRRRFAPPQDEGGGIRAPAQGAGGGFWQSLPNLCNAAKQR